MYLQCSHGFWGQYFSGWCFTHQYKNTTQFYFYAALLPSQNTKIKINLEMLPNWNDVWSVSNHEFVIVHVVYNAGTAIGSPKQCYPYGILITVTSTTSVKNGWQNFQIFIEDTVNNGSETGNIFVRSNNASSSMWKKFSGTNIGIV